MTVPTYTTSPRSLRRWLWPALATLTGLLGLCLGSIATLLSTSSDREVPQACLDAIAAAEDGFTYTSDALAGAHVGIWAAAEQDAQLLDDAAAVIEQAGEDLDQLYGRWDRARADCRAAAE